MMVLINKFAKQQNPSEEETKDENLFSSVRELIQSGLFEGSDKQIRLDDIFNAILGKIMDMPLPVIE